MNKFQIKGNWDEIKRKLQRKYAELTDDDLHFAEGKEEDLLGRLQQRLGRSKEHLRGEIEGIQEDLRSVRDKALNTLHAGEEYLRANPVPAFLAALMFGAVLGALLVPRRRKEPDAVQAVRDWLERSLEDFSKQWPKLKRQAHSIQNDLLHEAQHLGRKLHFRCP